MLLTIYEGPLDASDKGKIINIVIGDDNIEFNIEKVINAHNKVLLDMEPEDLKYVSLNTETEIRILSKGIHAKLLSLQKYDPNTCYFDYVTSSKEIVYLICIAFDEMQPTIYKGQLVAVLEINKTGKYQS